MLLVYLNKACVDTTLATRINRLEQGLNMERRPIEPLDISGPAHVVAERWRKWKRSFTFYIDGQGIENPRRQRSLLLHYAGMDVQDLHEGLEENSMEDNVYERTIGVLDAHFIVEPNTPYERYAFRQMTLKENESVDQFATGLRQQAARCNFADTDDQIRDQIVERIRDPGLQRKLLETANIGLNAVLQTARSWEAADQQSKGIKSTPATSVHAVQRRKGRKAATSSHHDSGRERPVCGNCG